MSRRRQRLVVAAAWACAAGVLLGGCGGDAPTAEPASASSTASASPTTEPSPPPGQPSTSSDVGGGPTGTPAPGTTTPTPTPSPAAPTAQPTDQPTKAPPYDGPPRTYDEALARVERATAGQELSRFESPSGNLYCVLDSPYLPPSCELAKGAIPDPAACPDGGPSQSVGRIEFTEAAPQPVCNTDTIREPGAPVLGYGGAASWADTTVTCVLEELGVTCVNPPSMQGFFLARGRYQVF